MVGHNLVQREYPEESPEYKPADRSLVEKSQVDESGPLILIAETWSIKLGDILLPLLDRLSR